MSSPSEFFTGSFPSYRLATICSWPSIFVGPSLLMSTPMLLSFVTTGCASPSSSLSYSLPYSLSATAAMGLSSLGAITMVPPSLSDCTALAGSEPASENAPFPTTLGGYGT